jgi:hypothetical protein
MTLESLEGLEFADDLADLPSREFYMTTEGSEASFCRAQSIHWNDENCVAYPPTSSSMGLCGASPKESMVPGLSS